jgi:hypothetical protein
MPEMEAAHQGDALINTNDPFPPPQPQKKGRKMRAAGKLRKKFLPYRKEELSFALSIVSSLFFLENFCSIKMANSLAGCAWVERK